MGWHRTRELKVEKANEAADKCGLWTRGGLDGLEVRLDDNVIHIPLVTSPYLPTSKMAPTATPFKHANAHTIRYRSIMGFSDPFRD